MEKKKNDTKRSTLLEYVWIFFRKCLFFVLSYGPMPNHIAFIMDGNRRFAKSKGMNQGEGHSIGFAALLATLQYCYEMGLKYVTVYAFSIDNFKRKPDEVQSLMNLMKEKIDELLEQGSIVNKYEIRIIFWGNLKLLSEPVRLSAERVMANTANNKGPVLSVCAAYTSTNEIVHAIEESCTRTSDKLKDDDGTDGIISVEDMEEHLFTAGCPDPNIVIRTSGETRLSNFLLWQTTFTHLQNPVPLWPEFSFKHLVWAVLQYQKVYPYLRKIQSKSKRRS